MIAVMSLGERQDGEIEALRVWSKSGYHAAKIVAVARLLAEGNTIPFIARYRKEANGNWTRFRSQFRERWAITAREVRRGTILK
jgi:transcriptional accessory protein Tex/SPT6